jgi:hypothetical protein
MRLADAQVCAGKLAAEQAGALCAARCRSQGRTHKGVHLPPPWRAGPVGRRIQAGGGGAIQASRPGGAQQGEGQQPHSGYCRAPLLAAGARGSRGMGHHWCGYPSPSPGAPPRRRAPLPQAMRTGKRRAGVCSPSACGARRSVAGGAHVAVSRALRKGRRRSSPLKGHARWEPRVAAEAGRPRRNTGVKAGSAGTGRAPRAQARASTPHTTVREDQAGRAGVGQSCTRGAARRAVAEGGSEGWQGHSGGVRPGGVRGSMCWVAATSNGAIQVLRGGRGRQQPRSLVTIVSGRVAVCAEGPPALLRSPESACPHRNAGMANNHNPIDLVHGWRAGGGVCVCRRPVRSPRHAQERGEVESAGRR